MADKKVDVTVKVKEDAGVTPGVIKVRVIDEKNGLTQLENVRAIRIHSGDYVLLIMKDYSPTLGQIDGTVIFLVDDREITLRNVKGCFKHQSNQFVMIIEEEMVN